MFCFNCGTKLVDHAKFCSSCGTAMQATPQQQPAESAPVEPNAAFHEPLNDADSFVLFGYQIELPEETKEYVLIRDEFQQLAENARQQMAKNFDVKYRSMDDLIRFGDNDSDSMFDAAVQRAMDMLKSRGIYNVNVSRFLDSALDHTGYWEANFSEIREKFTELIEYKEAKKDYRAGRKAGRGRLVGGGFGVGGAVKGMAMAGTANMATGLFHSFANALGNAATSAEVSSLKSKIFKDPETKRTLCSSIYLDIFYLHLAVVECIDDSELSLAAESYSSSEREEAITIYNNIMNGSVRSSDLNRMIVEILVKDPFDMDYYKLAMEHRDESDDLIEYARYFEMPIDDLLQKLKDEQENIERLSQTFGASAALVDSRLEQNRLYHAVKTDLSKNPTEALQKAFFSIHNDSIRANVFLVPGDSSEKLAKKMENAKASYAPYQTETPILLFDNTAFGSAKDGFLITDRSIYVHNMMSKGWSRSYQEIERMSYGGSEIIIDGKPVDINLIGGKERGAFYDFVELIIIVFKYGGKFAVNDENIHLSQAAAETVAMKLEVSASVNETAKPPVRNTDQAVEEIRSAVLSIKNQGIRKYVFIENESENVNKKFQNARQAYANLEPDEKTILLFDNTAFGGAKDGCLLTNRRLYIHNMLEKPIVIDLNSLLSVELNGSKLLFNQHALQVNMISSSDRPEFKLLIEEFINRLR